MVRESFFVLAYDTAENHSLEYWNVGSILSPSFVPPGSTILLSVNVRLS
jgi:hypothetical protein